ncbi:MAG: SDR family NAD(P)-dependent oxidoreductase [Rhodobacteraceae bacterium]|nr:SDR family NAD(P)-dependent oxidoreductase [Paracoccaceae bacterium]
MGYQDICASGGVAVITGSADGIGLAVADRLAADGLQVVLADLDDAALRRAAERIRANTPDAQVVTCETDVTREEQVRALADLAFGLGPVVFMMNNAGIGRRSSTLAVDDSWAQMMDVNFFGAVRGVDAFVPKMVTQNLPAMIVNTGSKQGITTPPGNPGYNCTKAALKVLTEQLSHELREAGAPISVHLLVPGFTYTGMIRSFLPEKPPAAWTPEQVAGFLVERLEQGDFYILCPDNDVSEEIDRRRVAWAAGDIIENRPALSRWHPDFADAFDKYEKG